MPYFISQLICWTLGWFLSCGYCEWIACGWGHRIFCFSIHFYFAYIPRRKTAASCGVSFFQVRDFCPFLAYHFVRWWWVRWCWVSRMLRAHVPLRSLEPIMCYFYGERFGELLCCFPQQVYRSTILLAIHQDSNSATSLLSCTLPHFLPFCGLLPFSWSWWYLLFYKGLMLMKSTFCLC